MSSLSLDREKKRERERRARQRRVARIESLRRKTEALERAVVVARTLGEEREAWSDFLDERTARVRHLLLRSLQLANETHALEIEQAQLEHLLQEHQLATHAIQGFFTNRPHRDWNQIGEHWRKLVREHYRPWTREECEEEMEAALKAVHAFKWRTDKETTGVSLDGWREVRRIDAARRLLQFEFYKTFHGYDIMDYVNMGWDCFTDPQTFRDVIGGHRMLVHHEILQQIGPNIAIIRVAERFPGSIGDVHVIYLVFRVRTDQGFLQCVRSIWCPEVMKVISGPNDMIALSNNIWTQWDRLDDGERGYAYRHGGSIGGVDVSYANRWMMEMFEAVVRGEQKATGRRFVISAAH